MVPFRLKSISQAADTFRGHMANNGACTYHNHSIRILSHAHTSILPCGCVPNTSENMVASNIDSTSRVSILNLHIRQASVCPAQAKSTMITSQCKHDYVISPISKYSHFAKFNAHQILLLYGIQFLIPMPESTQCSWVEQFKPDISQIGVVQVLCRCFMCPVAKQMTSNTVVAMRDIMQICFIGLSVHMECIIYSLPGQFTCQFHQGTVGWEFSSKLLASINFATSGH